MARMARVVVPFYPHHVTHRGNRRQPAFFGDFDYKTYLELMSEYCRKAGTRVWAYCLMPNHVHLVMVPSHLDGLRAALGEAHRQYTRAVNFRKRWRGRLWQERFHSFPMDEAYLLAAVRYVEQNPVAARLCRRASSVVVPAFCVYFLMRDRSSGARRARLKFDDWGPTII
jgi:REP-associated tyrosine transposase